MREAVKRVVTLGMVLITGITVALAGCSSDNPPVNNIPTSSGNRFNGINANEIKIITDAQTQCKYIYVDKGEGNYETTAMSPLMKDGKTVDCGK